MFVANLYDVVQSLEIHNSMVVDGRLGEFDDRYFLITASDDPAIRQFLDVFTHCVHSVSQVADPFFGESHGRTLP